MMQISPFLVLLVSLLFGALYGRLTSKPLWGAAVIPSVFIVGYLTFDIYGSHFFEGLLFICVYLIGACVLYGSLSYTSARLSRKPSSIRSIVQSKTMKVIGLTDKRSLILMLIVIGLAFFLEFFKKNIA
jgi:hypothetical protein